MLKGTNLSETIKKALTDLAAKSWSLTPDAVATVEFPNRVKANEWIIRRHGRGQEGEGRIPWGPLEIQRFQGDRTALDIIAFVETNSRASDTEWQGIKKAVLGNTSSLRRFIDSNAFREAVNLKVENVKDEKVPFFEAPASRVIAVLEKVFEDIASGVIDTRKFNKASQIKNYFDALPSDMKAKSNEAKSKLGFKDAIVADGKARPRQPGAAPKPIAAKTPVVKVPPIRTTLAPTHHTFSIPTTSKGQQLLREAAKIRLADYPLGSAYILRAFLEHTVDMYMTTHNLPFREGATGEKQLDFSVRGDRVIQHLVAAKTATMNSLKGAKRVFADPSDSAGVKALNDYHHDRYQVPAADALRKAWDSSVGLFEAIYGAAK